jgi:hypothetical protein
LYVKIKYYNISVCLVPLSLCARLHGVVGVPPLASEVLSALSTVVTCIFAILHVALAVALQPNLFKKNSENERREGRKFLAV